MFANVNDSANYAVRSKEPLKKDGCFGEYSGYLLFPVPVLFSFMCNMVSQKNKCSEAGMLED